MSSLPPDDDGISNSDLAAPAAKAKRRRPRVNPGPAGAVSGVTLGHETPGHSGLPPDDDVGMMDDSTLLGHPNITPNVKKRPAAKKPRAKPKGQPQQSDSGAAIPAVNVLPQNVGEDDIPLPWTDTRLKDAAARIPSITTMPYPDLMEMYQGGGRVPPMKDRCDLWEIYSLPRLGPVLRGMGGKCRRSYDIQHFWDLSSSDAQRLLLQDVCILRPRFLMLSPPCRYVSLLMASNWSRMKRNEEKVLGLKDALSHIDLSMFLAQHQIQTGGLFGFEHPHGSLAWGRDSDPWLIFLWLIFWYLFTCFENFDPIFITLSFSLVSKQFGDTFQWQNSS